MNPHLYILPFNDKQFLKIGISLNNNFNRINKLSNIYDIDTDNIILYSSDNINNIKLLETNIKIIINEKIKPENIYYGKDGYTEIRNVKYLNDIINLINTLKPLLNIYELKFTKQTPPIKKEKYNIPNINNNIIPNHNAIHNIINTLDNIKQYITKINRLNNRTYIILNLTNICQDNITLDNILNPLTQSLYINNIKLKLNNGYEYNKTFNEVKIQIDNTFNIKHNTLSKENKRLQHIYNLFINNLYINYYNI